MYKLSIVIPMYNSFELLTQNLKILEKQDCTKVEIIIVDDCSTDISYIKALEYAKKTVLNLKVLKNKSNSGPGVARNEGMKQASGEYLTFVDSDDFLSDVFIKKIMKYLNGRIDCLIFDYAFVTDTGMRIRGGRSIGSRKIKQGYLDPKMALVFTYGSTAGKIYKRKLIMENQVQYGDFFRNEDLVFTKHALAICKSVFYLQEELYNYVQIGTSLMHTTTLTNEKNCQKAFDLLTKQLYGTGLQNELRAIELREVLNNSVLIMIGRKVPYRQINRYVKEYYSKTYINNIYFKEYPSYVKIITILIYCRVFPAISLIWRYKEWKKRR